MASSLLRCIVRPHRIQSVDGHYLPKVILTIIIPAKARDYVFTGVGLSVCLFVCLFVCYHDN